MNCKPGDLAVIIRAEPGDGWLGRIVTVLHLYEGPSLSPAWVCDQVPPGFRAIKDSALRPIRDNDGEDEMLRIAGKPREISHA